MPGLSTAIEVQDAEVRAAFQRMLAGGASPREYLDAIGNTVAQNTRLRFIESRSPEGAPWRRVLRGGQPLRDTGTHLMNAISHRVEGDSVVVGVPYAWASVHQFGAIIRAKLRPYLRFKVGQRWASKKEVTIPARPFLGISADDRIGITQILQRVLVGK